MGSGKSFFAQEVSRIAHIPFIDMDDYIEEKEGLSIAEIFEKKGEYYFRIQEQKILKLLIEKYKNTNIIIATGGGTPCHFNNMNKMNLFGTTIYFNLSAHRIFELLKRELSKRPLLKNLSEKELFLFIQKTLLERNIFYKKATFSLSEKQVNTKCLLQIIHTYI
ncbi:MAG: shikimate kinase [Chitinophagaceae bacterium]